MTRRRNQKKNQCSAPDHRPMLPEFRRPEDVLDSAIRTQRLRLEELHPNQQTKWR